MAEGAEVALEGIRVAERLGLERRKGVWCRCDAAEALIPLGRYDEARRLLEEGAALGPAGVDAVRTDYVTGHLMIRLGDFDAATEHLERARTNGEHLLDGQLVAPLHAGLVELATRLGDVDEARRLASVRRGPAAGVCRPHLRLPAVRRRRGRGDGGRPGRAPSRSTGGHA